MEGFSVSVVPDSGDGKVPVGLAGQIMIDIQQILGDIGEYLVAKELRIQNTLHPDLLDRFVLYLDGDGGMTFGASVTDSKVEGHGNIVDDAIELMDAVLTALGSGTGGYWMEDRFTDPIYRNNVIADVLAISEHMAMSPGYSLMFGPRGAMKRFGRVDADKLQAFVKDRGLTANGATLGVLVKVPSKSKGDMIYLQCGKDRARLSFYDRASENRARGLVGSPVLIGGRMAFSKAGELLEIRDAAGVTPVSSIRFRRMISCDGDILLKNPVQADVVYSSGIWTLRNDDLGISSTKDSWDAAVQTFHDYFVFLWTQYGGKDPAGESGEEAEVSAYLNSLME